MPGYLCGGQRMAEKDADSKRTVSTIAGPETMRGEVLRPQRGARGRDRRAAALDPSGEARDSTCQPV